ncbi:MAG: hypothetical protein AB7V46_12110, partial [Thermomicrobiales bacterium]
MIAPRVLLAVICLMATASSTLGQVDGWDPGWPMSKAVVEELGAPPREMAQYSLDVSLDPARQTLGGSFEVLFANHTGETIDNVPFRLFPNADYYGDGGTAVTSVTVDGLPRSVTLDVLDTVLRVSLNHELAPGDTALIALDFETIVPVDS